MIVAEKIAKKLIDTLIEKGYSISVNDGEEWVLFRSTHYSSIIASMFSTDHDVIEAGIGKDKIRFLLIYENGEDVISDFTDTPEAEEIFNIVVDE